MVKKTPKRSRVNILARLPKYIKVSLAVAVIVGAAGVAGSYIAGVIHQHQVAAKLGWTPDPNSDPGNDSSLKPSVADHTSLVNDEQLNETPTPTPAKSVPGAPSIDLKVADDQMTNLGIFTAPGESSKVVWIKLTPTNLELSSCSLTDEVTLDDLALTHQTKQLIAKAYQEIPLVDGLHQISASCQGGKVASGMKAVRIMDRQPKACKGFAFNDSSATASSLDGLKSGIIGTWKGCVTTPWVPPYEVTMTFNADDTYQAVSNEVIDGQAMIAMYYGSDSASPEKKYTLDSFQDALGGGSLDIFFWAGNTNHDPLSNVKLMGNNLSFDFLHRDKYGPLKFQLVRQ